MTIPRKYPIALLAAALLWFPGDASAFVRAEHEWLSRRAMCLAIVDLERTVASGSEGRGRDALRVLKDLQEGAEGPADYGQLVAYGDYVTFPNDMVDTARSGAARISTRHVRARLLDSVAEYTEMLRNPHHFRQLGLSQFHIWHDTAVARAREDDGEDAVADPLWDALAYNAYADHFLEDFFAPGHMTRDPDGLSHMGNLRVHDTDNWTGRSFEPSAAAREELARVPGAGAQQREEAWRRCFPPEDGISLADFEDAIAPLSVELKGDNQVYREGEGVLEGQQRQAVFTVLVVARSILDVVDSYTGGQIVNHFPNHRCPSFRAGADWLERAAPPDDCYFVLDETEQNYYFAATRFGGYLSDPDASRSAWVWPTLGGSTELQRVKGSSRWQNSLEVLFDLPSQEIFDVLHLSADWNRHFSFELGTGYSYVNQGVFQGTVDYNGHGPDLRLYVRAKQLYMFAAAEAGWRFYDGFGKSTNNWRAGGRLGFGNGIFWAYGSIFRDKKLTSTGARSDPLAVGLGVAVTLPSTRLLGWMWGH